MTTDLRRDIEVTETTAPSVAEPARRSRSGMVLATLIAAGLFGLGCSVTGEAVTYDLPAESARYTFEAETDGVKTQWEYLSAKPTADDVTKSQPCMGEVLGIEGECRPEPLIFLRYDLGLELDNTVKAGSDHPITITGYYQERLSTPPTVTNMQVEASFDGGKTWQPVTVSAKGTNTFGATIRNPKKDATGAVSLRTTASDSQGNTVKQTMPTAYRLS
ncbi:hypothetical protein AB0D32_14005 [Micromonospora sp. NPDC048170]|uniref:hypothetical protein n=1 Tax=Micromonospora sp. NPDC048170 TaxID=3154819 RepID=UPI00340F5336